MTDIETKNAIIESAVLTKADHGVLSGWLHLDYDGSGQGFGGYVLYLPANFKNHQKQFNYAGHWIYRVLQIAGVDTWDALPGKTIRVKATHSRVEAIGHIVKDEWFDPQKEFQQMEGAA